ncbi:MAG: hypothetical protein WKF84_11785 [Pyrinomonadaceae bacterium]
MSYSLSVQRELPRGFFAEVAYVGNYGRRLLRQPDINQASFDVLSANAALPAAQRACCKRPAPVQRLLFNQTTAVRLLRRTTTGCKLYVTKRKGDLLLTGSYTWSKALTNASGNFDNPEDPFNQGNTTTGRLLLTAATSPSSPTPTAFRSSAAKAA